MKYVILALSLFALASQPVFAEESQAAQSEPSEELIAKCTNQGMDKGLEGSALDDYVDNCLNQGESKPEGE